MLKIEPAKAQAAAFSVFSVVATAVLGSQYTQQSVQTPWYDRIRPAFAPPSWVFPVVWTTLYAILAVAMYLSLLRDSSFLTGLHVANLILNVVWCWVFFGRRELGWAIPIILANIAVAVSITYFTNVEWVRWLLLPYIAWLSFATALNGGAYQKSV
jgi:tryptophan-rich sensory protein